MNIRDASEYALKNLMSSSLRSWLTIIGVVIGVIAMVVITSVAEGVNSEITTLMSSFGPDKMFVIPVNIDSAGGGVGGFSGGMPAFGKLYQRDVDSISAVPGVESVARMVLGRATLAFKDKQITSQVYGADSEVFVQFGDFFKIEKGRSYASMESRVVVLGYAAANDMFGKDKLDVGSVLKINNKDFRVIGVLKKQEGGALTSHDDSAIFVPFEDGRELFGSQLAKNEVNFVYVDLADGFDPEEVKATIEGKLASNHRVTLDEKDFSVITSEFIKKTVGDIIDILSRILFAVTAVATVVGGIGIANTMFMSVLERVREIGILKSIGATGRDIQLIFITESAMIGFLGGILGFAIALAILYVAGGFGVPYLIRIRWVLFVFVFSAGVGVVAGYLPARNAAKMDPVEALRQ